MAANGGNARTCHSWSAPGTRSQSPSQRVFRAPSPAYCWPHHRLVGARVGRSPCTDPCDMVTQRGESRRSVAHNPAVRRNYRLRDWTPLMRPDLGHLAPGPAAVGLYAADIWVLTCRRSTSSNSRDVILWQPHWPAFSRIKRSAQIGDRNQSAGFSLGFRPLAARAILIASPAIRRTSSPPITATTCPAVMNPFCHHIS